MIRAIADAVKFLEHFVPTPEKKHPGEPGLVRMRELVSRIGNPQLLYPTIHVGGTSGKGSTATIIATMLATRYKVGLHTSPHLVWINERILISRGPLARQTRGPLMEEITDGEFIALVDEIRPYVEQMKRGKYGASSYFEIVTAMAFMYFAKKKVDIAVIEVGMGGRFDATNVINPVVAVITNVGLDHTEILGETVDEIARDKVGIIKSGMRVVSGVTQPSVINILKEKCAEMKVQLSLLEVPPPRGSPDMPATPGVSLSPFGYRIKQIDSSGCVFDYYGNKSYQDLQLSLLGAHQVENAALAIRAIKELLVVGYQLSVEDVKQGLRLSYIPGRLEIVRRNPTVILDGAHNPDKMKALVEAIKTIWKSKKVTAIIAIKEDKNAREMLEILLPICSKIILTQYRVKMDQGEIVSYMPNELKRVVSTIGRGIPVQIINDPNTALHHAIKLSKKDDMILITGSLYLIGMIKLIRLNHV